MDSETLVITKLDEVYLHIECEDALAEELSAFFTFRVPGCEFSPAFRKRHWDGMIRLFNRKSHLIYVGLLAYVKAFAKERGYKLIGSAELESADEFSVHEAKEYVKSLKPHAAGKALEVDDYQYAALIYAIRYKRMLLVSPTASGKSFIQYMIFRYLADVKGQKKGLLIVPTTALVEQMYGDFIDYSSHNKFNVKKNCYRIYDYPNVDRNAEYPLLISTWQSIYDMPKKYFEKFDYILGDEAHLFKADSLTEIMTKSVNAAYKIGATGTLDGTKTHKLVLEGLFGRVRQFVTTKQLQDRGRLAQLTIKCLFLTYPKEASMMVIDSKYHDELDFILAHRARNNFIKNLALSLNGNTLLLFQYVDKHGVILRDLVESAVAERQLARKVFYVYGGTETEQRDKIRAIAESNPSGCIFVCSYGTFSTGVNIKHIHNIILTSPTKSRIRVLQSIGRGLRLGEFKEHCTLFDIIDDFSMGAETNTTLDHFQERFSYYVGEDFDYRFYNVHIKGEA